ncbi:hypothetical protein H106_07403 [Trichophyton rubrum CBS 735.88]|nr:hypothetical protein H106_07403 [Trichophyton rubrum CBS 735.88]
MTEFPTHALNLHGGCLCKAVRYTIKVPQASDRGAVKFKSQALPANSRPDGRENKEGAENVVNIDLPIISIDHCSDCRHAAGAPVQAWFICPQEWIEWDVAVLSPANGLEERVKQTTLQACSKDGQGFYEDEPNPYLVPTFLSKYSSSEDVTRTFCARCGTNFTYFTKRPRSSPTGLVVDITIGSMNDESSAVTRPTRHAWYDSGIPWLRTLMRGAGAAMPRARKGISLGLMREDEE